MHPQPRYAVIHVASGPSGHPLCLHGVPAAGESTESGFCKGSDPVQSHERHFLGREPSTPVSSALLYTGFVEDLEQNIAA